MSFYKGLAYLVYLSLTWNSQDLLYHLNLLFPNTGRLGQQNKFTIQINKNKNILPSISDTPGWSSEMLSFGSLLGGAEQLLSVFMMTVHLVKY